jgi:phosphoribosylaminoimidazole carboxylase PurE protein
MTKPVAFMIGSDSDLPQLEGAFQVLRDLEIGFHVRILSAHRTPDEAAEFAKGAHGQGIKVLIGAAGMAAHLAGALAAHSNLPVLGIPVDSGPMRGEDALYSTAMMPPGIPVGTLGIGKAGAKNAALLAARIVALTDASITERLVAYRERERQATLAKDDKVREQFDC